MAEPVDEQKRVELLRRLESGEDLATIERELGLNGRDDDGSDERWVVPTLAEVAAFLGCHEATIKGWRGEGMPASDNGWDLQAITQWRLARLSKYDGTKDESTRALLREKLKIDTERKRLDLEERRGRLVYRDAVHSELSEILNVVRVRLQAVPGEIASSVPSDVRALVMEESTAKVITALNELARCSLVEEGPPDVVFQT